MTKKPKLEPHATHKAIKRRIATPSPRRGEGRGEVAPSSSIHQQAYVPLRTFTDLQRTLERFHLFAIRMTKLFKNSTCWKTRVEVWGSARACLATSLDDARKQHHWIEVPAPTLNSQPSTLNPQLATQGTK